MLCSRCRRFFRGDYENCPFCTVDGISVLTTVAEGQLGTYTYEPKRRRARRGGDYYWQLYLDYGDKLLAAPEVSTLDLSLAETAVPEDGANGMSVLGTHAPTEGNGTANGQHLNGSYKDGQREQVDLAVTETVSLNLFGDGAHLASGSNDSGTAKSVGNYNVFEHELIQDQSRLAEVAELLAGETMLGLDTETTGLDPHTSELLLLQISTVDKVYIVDCRRVVPLPLKAILESPAITKVAQNAKFEYEMLRQQSGITLANLYDTMLAERLLTAGISREISLKAIADKYIGAILDKSVRESFYKLAGNGDAYLAPEQLHYAARDAFIMIPIRSRQAVELKKQGLEQIATIEFQCVAAVGDMELVGVRIDQERWRKIIADVTIQREAAASELAELLLPASMQATMFGVSSINLNSNQQLVEALSRLGVDVPDTMESTLVKYDHPAIKKLLDYRAHEKTLSAFGENVLGLINPKTNRIHPDFNQYGADTGRFSCTRPNVQQIPATSDFRKCFVAAEGYKLVTSDYSQCELRILAELSGDPGFVNAFKSGGDLHTLTASQMFGVPVEQVEKPQRNAAKAINFGLAYGMGPGGLAPRLGVSLDEAKELIARYFRAYPLIQRWLDKAARDAVRVGYSATTLGRKRYYNIPDESLKRTSEDDYRKQIASIERQGKNSPIQGSNADMTKLALIFLRSALKGWDARTVNTVHDEIVVEARQDQAEDVKHLVEDAMVRAGKEILKEVPIVAEAAVADYWSK
jgi:DNA polymerase I-like protein with 3'-5' exonuclease and polymerase domains